MTASDDDCPSCGPRLDERTDSPEELCADDRCGHMRQCHIDGPITSCCEPDTTRDGPGQWPVCPCNEFQPLPLVHEDHRVSAQIVLYLVSIGLLGLLAWALWAVVFP